MEPAVTLKDRWASGDETLGAWLTSRDPLVAEATGRSGFDYVCVDMQHGTAEIGDLLTLVNAIELGGSIPVARVSWNDPAMLGRALDSGCHGVIVPMVNSAEQARSVVTACRYAPLGSRSWGPITAGQRHDEYRTWADRSIAVIPMIETAEALANLDEILAVPGIDAAYVGPADLAISLGLGPTGNDGVPAFDNALSTIVAACRHHGVLPGIHSDGSTAVLRRSQGFQMITVATDVVAMRTGLAASLHAASGH
ncbi:MAG: HpcH/HpaI aldolase family protein [Ilumatobacteraceae bacterium]